ncbi:MAG: hypothetical protein IKU64_08105 [Bacteroides sp.]|nr:hypothetical protein [Bacteroides sp.]
MAPVSLNLKLDYSQNELISEFNKDKLKYFQNLFSCDESEQITMDEIQAEVNEARRERYETRRKELSHSLE